MIQKANKAENKTWKMVGPVVVLTCIGLVITAALAVTNQLTAPVIEAQAAAAAEAALKVVLPEGSDFTDITGVELPEGITAAKAAGNGAGYVFTTTGKGFGGDISVMVGLNADGAITGTKVLSNAETQGIGSKVVEDGSAYQQQLVGMTDTSGIQATSGATVSSNAMTSAIQTAFDAYVLSTGGTVEAKVYEAPANLTDDVLAQYYSGATFTDVAGGKVSDAGTVVYGAAQGMLSEVRVAVFFDANDTILGIVADCSQETPGLGTLAGEEGFTSQFAGVESADGVDTITGATISSTAVKDAVNLAIANLQTVKEAG